MSENGPYNQPPQNPYGGGDGSGRPSGPHGPGGYAPPPQPPRGGGGSKVGLWVAIGGTIIVVVVIAVIIMLATRGTESEEAATGPDETTRTAAETDDAADDETDTGGDVPTGGPPYALPAEPCEAITDLSGFKHQNASINTTDLLSSCSVNGSAPDGNPDGAYSALWVEYKVPSSGSESVEAASSEFQEAIDDYTGGLGGYPKANVKEDKAIDGLGDEAHLIITERETASPGPTAVLITRAANMNVTVMYKVDSPERAELVMMDDVEALLTSGAEGTLTLIGAE